MAPRGLSGRLAALAYFVSSRFVARSEARAGRSRMGFRLALFAPGFARQRQFLTLFAEVK
jgi:hypothetical protein